ncbi:MAG: hypothetical protein DRP63_05645, partial [Planctomycetota bacterium]
PVQSAQVQLTLVIWPELMITTAALPDAYEGQVGYSAAVQTTGGKSGASLTWTIVSGGLPSNLSLDPASGVISGDLTASSAGTYMLVVSVTDGIATDKSVFALTVHTPLTVTTTGLPDAYSGQTGYSAALTASGGAGGYTWSVVSGSLPASLVLNSNGQIGGSVDASAHGLYSFDVAVTDGIQTVTVSMGIRVWERLRIETTALPGATEGVTYSFGLTAAGGDASGYQWSASGLPSGLDVDPATGEITGAPDNGTASGSPYMVTVEVTDGLQYESRVLALEVYPELEADFSTTPEQGMMPLTVVFVDESKGNITKWEWDFDGDGVYDRTDVSPPGTFLHTYNRVGWHTVRLKVTGPSGSDEEVKERCVLVARAVWYVDDANGDDTNSGRSWSEAWKTLGHAASQAGDYDVVLVSDCVYTGAGNRDVDFGGKKIYFKGVDIYPGGETRPVIDCESQGRAFYFHSGEDRHAVIDNFVIRDGKRPGNDLVNSSGAGICCTDDSAPTIVNCLFKGNRAGLDGGAILCYYGSPTIADCTFDGNIATYWGGAVYCRYGDPLIKNCVFTNNRGLAGGGALVCSTSGSPTVSNCTFTNNSSGHDGGAISCYQNTSKPTIVNCTFTGNTASTSGGAVYCGVGSHPTMRGCSFYNNQADAFGGAVCAISSDLSIEQCVFITNKTVSDDGGALFVDGGTHSVINCLFVGNHSADNGGAIYARDATCDLTITNCTFCANSAADRGGAVYCYSSAQIYIYNTILWNDTAVTAGNEVHNNASSPGDITLDYCCVSANGYGGDTSRITETNTTNDDPQFVDEQGPDGNPGTGDEDLHLRDVSPCLDTGDSNRLPSGVTTDLDGVQRIVGGAVDIGAYEWQGPDLVVTTMVVALPNGYVGVSYNYPLNAYGGTTPYTWSARGLPAGLSIDASSGTISGTPASGSSGPQPYSITVTVRDADGRQTSKTFQLFILPARSGTTTWYVDPQNGDDTNAGTSPAEAFATIEWALFVAQDTDTIILADGTYYEHDLDFCGKEIHLKSANGPANCVIDCQRRGRAFWFHSGETSSTIIEGITLRSGKANLGGAVLCEDSDPTITGCVFEANSADDCGGAIYSEDADLTTTNCIFKCNKTTNDDGGALYLSGGTHKLTNCLFVGNHSADNGGAIYARDATCDLTITNCTFCANSADDHGGAVYCYNGAQIYIYNTILWNDTAVTAGNEVHNNASSPGDITLDHCCVSANGYGGETSRITETNTTNDDPQFIDEQGPDGQAGTGDEDLHLVDGSPCVDAGDNGYVSGVT